MVSDVYFAAELDVRRTLPLSFHRVAVLQRWGAIAVGTGISVSWSSSIWLPCVLNEIKNVVCSCDDHCWLAAGRPLVFALSAHVWR